MHIDTIEHFSSSEKQRIQEGQQKFSEYLHTEKPHDDYVENDIDASQPAEIFHTRLVKKEDSNPEYQEKPHTVAEKPTDIDESFSEKVLHSRAKKMVRQGNSGKRKNAQKTEIEAAIAFSDIQKNMTVHTEQPANAAKTAYSTFLQETASTGKNTLDTENLQKAGINAEESSLYIGQVEGKRKGFLLDKQHGGNRLAGRTSEASLHRNEVTYLKDKNAKNTKGKTAQKTFKNMEAEAVSSDKQVKSIVLNLEELTENNITQKIGLQNKETHTSSTRMPEVMQGLAKRLNGDLGRDIVRQASVLLQDSDRGEIRLVIRPPELGRVRIRLQMNNGYIAGRIFVDNGDVREVIQQNIVSLQDAFEEAGLEMGQLDVRSGDTHDSGTNNTHAAHTNHMDVLESSVKVVSEYIDRKRIVNLVA